MNHSLPPQNQHHVTPRRQTGDRNDPSRSTRVSSPPGPTTGTAFTHKSAPPPRIRPCNVYRDGPHSTPTSNTTRTAVRARSIVTSRKPVENPINVTFTVTVP